MPGMRSRSGLAALALLVEAWSTPAVAATARRALDAYGLVATHLLRARSLQVTNGDLGVVAGPLYSTGGLTAPGAQIVASTARFSGLSTCAAVLSDDVSGGSAACPTGGAGVPHLFADLTDACGLPTAVPACNSTAPRLVVTDSARRLPPGVYGDVVVSTARAGLDLTGGTYIFCNLRVARGAQVRVHGPSEVRIVGRLLLSGALAPAPGVAVSASDIRVQVFGTTVRAARGALLSAVLCAPQATARLTDSTLQGRVVADRIKAVRGTVAAPYAEDRAPCAARSRLRNVYFGDLHVHTTLSFDAYAFDVRTTPAQAYQFAHGAPVQRAERQRAFPITLSIFRNSEVILAH